MEIAFGWPRVGTTAMPAVRRVRSSAQIDWRRLGRFKPVVCAAIVCALLSMLQIAHAQQLIDSDFYKEADPVIANTQRVLALYKCLPVAGLGTLRARLVAARDGIRAGQKALERSVFTAGDLLSIIHEANQRLTQIDLLLQQVARFPRCKQVNAEDRRASLRLMRLLREGTLAEPPEPGERQEIGARPGGPRIQLASWTGGFFGVQGEGSFSGVQTFEFSRMSGMLTNRFDDRGNGAGGGINFGWNWQPWTPTTLFGVVVDINGLNDSVRHDFAGGSSISSVVNFNASVQLRGGVLVVPSLLLYGQGGFVVANEQLKIDFGGPKTDESTLVPGGTIGFGAELQLATNPLPFGRSLSLFGEYGHTWLGDARLRMPAASPGFDYTWRRETDTVKFGARINWGDGPPQ